MEGIEHARKQRDKRVMCARPGPLRACLKTPPDRRVRARGLQKTSEIGPGCRPGPLTGRVFKQALSADFVRRLTRLKIYALALGERTMELLNVEQVRGRRMNGK